MSDETGKRPPDTSEEEGALEESPALKALLQRSLATDEEKPEADRQLVADIAAQLGGVVHARGLMDSLRRAQERLVLARTTAPRAGEEPVGIDWGEAFSESLRLAFPERPNPAVSVSYGPLALDYILTVGGSGYFREGFIRPYLEAGRLEVVPNSPAFAYPAYLVSSEKTDPAMLPRIREGLRLAAAERI